MSTRSKRFLTFLLCAAIASNFGCTTTTHGVGPSKAAMNDYKIGRNTATINWYVNEDHPRIETIEIDPNQPSRRRIPICGVVARIVNPGLIVGDVIKHVAKLKVSRSKSERETL